MPNLAKANLLARKTRSVVTIFGVAISVALMLILAGMANGTIRDIVNRIMSIGADIMVGSKEIGLFYPSQIVPTQHKDNLQEIEGVEHVAPVLIESAPQINEIKQFNYIYGIDYEDYVKLGEGFTYVQQLDGEPLSRPGQIIIDEEVANENGFRPGDTITILNKEWTLYGIVKEALGARYYVNRKELLHLVRPETAGTEIDRCTVFYVTVDEDYDVDEVLGRIKEQYGDRFSVRNVAELFEAFYSGALPLREFMVAQFGVSAIICFSVILLSMYNAIIERTREIGILKSLGATRMFIIGQILKEALAIVLMGIVLGIIIGTSSLYVITHSFSLLKAEITVDLLLISSGIAVLATLLGTFYPAFRASRLDPVEALSWE